VDFQLDEKQELFRRSVAEFVDKEVVPVADGIDKEGQFPTELLQNVGELSYAGVRATTNIKLSGTRG